ncbi:hypothetical protein WA158_002342 [Blastocystis sp. Blastoise]
MDPITRAKLEMRKKMQENAQRKVNQIKPESSNQDKKDVKSKTKKHHHQSKKAEARNVVPSEVPKETTKYSQPESENDTKNVDAIKKEVIVEKNLSTNQIEENKHSSTLIPVPVFSNPKPIASPVNNSISNEDKLIEREIRKVEDENKKEDEVLLQKIDSIINEAALSDNDSEPGDTENPTNDLDLEADSDSDMDVDKTIYDIDKEDTSDSDIDSDYIPYDDGEDGLYDGEGFVEESKEYANKVIADMHVYNRTFEKKSKLMDLTSCYSFLVFLVLFLVAFLGFIVLFAFIYNDALSIDNCKKDWTFCYNTFIYVYIYISS